MKDDWGIPDWNDLKSYGRTELWSNSKWRWEFNRRRTDLREDFDQQANDVYRRELALFETHPEMFLNNRVLKPDEAGFSVTTRLIRANKTAPLPNPRISDQPELLLNFDSPDALSIHFSIDPPDGYSRIDFDLSRPIAPQIKAAQKSLIEDQTLFLGSKKQVRQHSKKWLLYLRIIDGRATGASWDELSELCYHQRNEPQAARDIHKQAKALCFNFPF